MSYQLKVMSDFMFVKCKIQNSCAELPSGVKDSLRAGGVRSAQEEVTQMDRQT